MAIVPRSNPSLISRRVGTSPQDAGPRQGGRHVCTHMGGSYLRLDYRGQASRLPASRSLKATIRDVVTPCRSISPLNRLPAALKAAALWAPGANNQLMLASTAPPRMTQRHQLLRKQQRLGAGVGCPQAPPCMASGRGTPGPSCKDTAALLPWQEVSGQRPSTPGSRALQTMALK